MCYNSRMENLEIIKTIKNSKSVCIIGHIDPDADALASMTVLKDFLTKQFNILKVDIFAETNEVQDNCKNILFNHTINPEISSYDTAIALDSPNIDRLGVYSSLFKKAQNTYVIDHHETNTNFAKYNIVIKATSTVEILYILLEKLGYDFSKANLENIYAGIITDTNNFTTPNVNSLTFGIASKIVNKINYLDVYNNYFSNFSLSSMRLLARAINNSKTLQNNKILITYLTKNDFKKANATVNNITGIVNKLSTLSNNILTCLIFYKNGQFYVSMRAKNGYNVATIAKKYNGGGHAGASGFLIKSNVKNIIKLVENEFLSLLAK